MPATDRTDKAGDGMLNLEEADDVLSNREMYYEASLD